MDVRNGYNKTHVRAPPILLTGAIGPVRFPRFRICTPSTAVCDMSTRAAAGTRARRTWSSREWLRERMVRSGSESILGRRSTSSVRGGEETRG